MECQTEHSPEASDLDPGADLEGRIEEHEIGEEPREDNGEDHTRDGRYTIKHFKERGDKTNRKKEDDDISSLTEDNELVSHNKERVYGEGAIMPSRLISSEHKEKGQPYDTYDGAIVILYHIDKETGELYFSFERKPETHPLRGKLALYGGTVRVGETYNEALPRELKEEDPNGYGIILDALKNNGHYFTEVKDYIDGIPSTTKFWVAEIENPSNWKAYASTKTTEGDKAILSLEETIDAIRKKSFAYPQQEQAVRELIEIIMRYPPSLN